MGVSDRDALTIWRSDKGFDWRRYLKVLADHGFNYVRQNATAWIGLSSFRRYSAQFSRPRWAFQRTGPGLAVDGGLRFDLTRFDEVYFRDRLGPFLREAERRGMVVELTLFDACRSRRAFAQCLYAEQNNVNALGLKLGDGPHSDRALRNGRLLAVQEAYVGRILEATRRFGNVVYEIANETGGMHWVAHFVDFIHRRLPGALVSAGEQSSPYDPVAGKCDLIVKHRGAGGLYCTDEDVARHRASLMAFRRARKPVLHNEFFLFANRSTDDVNFVRKMFWADFTGGGHTNFYDFHWWRGAGRTMADGSPSQPPPAEILHAGQFLRRFIEDSRVPFAQMAPCDDLAIAHEPSNISPFVFARPGAAYVVYLIQGGSVTLELPARHDPWVGRWYNPRTGLWSRPFSAPSKRQTFTAPDHHDWVLYIDARPRSKPAETLR